MFLPLAVAIIAWVLTNNFSNQSVKQAQLDTESLTAQILMGGLKSLPNDENNAQGRGIASVGGAKFTSKIGLEGQLGKDPWSNPYRYKLLKNQSGEYSHIIVWSLGPNQQDESSSEGSLSEASPDHPPREHFFIKGDDIGYIRTIN